MSLFESLVAYATAEWTPSSIPATPTYSSIDATHLSGLEATISSVFKAVATETNYYSLISISQAFRGARASLDIVSAQEVLATATESSVLAQATQAIFINTLNLKALADDENLYGYHLSRPANIIYLTIFSIIFFYIVGMLSISRYHWYNICFFSGFGLEFAGFVGRVLSFQDNTNMNFYLLQYVTLTIAPAFIMGGIYFLFAQLVVIHGRKYSVLKPMWYSYFFIASDVLSLLIQAAGGGQASIASKQHRSTKVGRDIMIVGIVFQVVAMTIFLGFWFEFLNRIFFKHARENPEDPKFIKPSFKNFFRFLFNSKSIRRNRVEVLESHYNQKFKAIREKPIFYYAPLAVSIAVVVIYIRCVYRVVELAQGWNGYLIGHEIYLMVLDALMIAIAGLIFIPFHPVHILGRKNVVKLATIKKNKDEEEETEEEEANLVQEDKEQQYYSETGNIHSSQEKVSDTGIESYQHAKSDSDSR
ncbi:putative transporter or flippase transmembrane protein [Scheffersomyces amazonensis]|uniref:putative transporter or flippase transmembrane protein n=1 Tax=Scheffersomyces amazonensis TaxID=1078765 RepID=UPI00315D4B0D